MISDAIASILRAGLTEVARHGTAKPTALRVASILQDVGLTITDSGGRSQKPRYYAERLLRTEAAELQNAGHIATASQINSPGVRVFDGGPGDVDKPCEEANGQAWTLQLAMANRTEHPNCRRAFAPLPSTYTGEVMDSR